MDRRTARHFVSFHFDAPGQIEIAAMIAPTLIQTLVENGSVRSYTDVESIPLII